MHVEFVHQMPTVRNAYQSVLNLDDENNNLVCSSGIILLIRRDGSADWYFYVDLSDPSAEDKARILRVMDQEGIRTDQRIDDLLRNPHLGSCFSGSATQVAAELEELGKVLKAMT